jgi:hypothetical protein
MFPFSRRAHARNQHWEKVARATDTSKPADEVVTTRCEMLETDEGDVPHNPNRRHFFANSDRHNAPNFSIPLFNCDSVAPAKDKRRNAPGASAGNHARPA